MSVRILDFAVDKQRLTRQRYCDFSHIVAGSAGYLVVRFTFSDEWKDCKKVATFWYGGNIQRPVLLNEDDACVIPSDVTINETFYISVLGGKAGYRISTDRIKIKQEVF